MLYKEYITDEGEESYEVDWDAMKKIDKYNLLLQHTVPALLMLSLRLEREDIDPEEGIAEYIDRRLSEYLQNEIS